jgi:hypothetical protein
MAEPPVKIEAHGATHRAHDARGGAPWKRSARVEPGPTDGAPGADPFRLGFRYRLSTSAEGREVVEQVPLSAEDILYPQEGDVVSDGFPHNTGLQPRADALRRHLEKRGATLLTSNVTLVLRSDGRNCSPDIAVIAGEIDRTKIERAVDLRKVGGRLVFALEVVSTSEKEIEDKDVKHNVDRYAREKVPDYFTVYPVVESQVKDLVGRRLEKEGYDEIAPDAQGRVYSKELDLYFQVDDATRELVAIDARTGERLLTSDEEEAGRKKAEAALARAEAQRKKAEAARKKAEAARKQEADSRHQAEERAEQEAQARHHAEERLRRNVEDLCGLVGIDWSSERSAAVASMDSAQLETLWAHLVDRKRWP